ncbi:T9SS type A sorting domain-containing protein [Flavobacteriales bacterium]|nr:T9SS type A sorting domain-containing protein [Flavobacteriales bacterium]
MKKILLLIMSVIALQLNAQTITNYTTVDGLLSDFVECIEADVNDNIWLGTSVGVQKFDGSNLTAYTTADGLVNDNVKVITSASNGDIWVGTDFGASNFDGANWLTYDNTNGLNSNQVKSIDEDANGGIWIGTNLGVSYFDGTTWTSYSSFDLHWSGVNATAFDSNGDKWFASPLGGVTHFDDTTFTPYDTSNGLLSQFVTDILVDNNDNKWVGTSSGMSVLDASNTSFTQHTRIYIMPPPDTLNPVVDIAMDSYGRIWTAIYVGYLAEGGIAYWDGNQWEDFHVSDGLVGPNVRGLVIDSDDNVWVAASTGVSKISAITSAVVAAEIATFNLFPNPSNDVLYLNNGTQNIQQVKMYDNLGALVYLNDNKKQQYKIDVSSFSKGLYYVNIHSFDAIIRKKIVVN